MEKTRGSTDGRADKGAVARYMVEYVFIPVLLLYNVEFLSTVRQGASALQVHSSTPIRVPPGGHHRALSTVPCGLQYLLTACHFIHRGGRRKRQPTAVFLPGKSHEWRNVAGCSPRVATSQTRLSEQTVTAAARVKKAEGICHSVRERKPRAALAYMTQMQRESQRNIAAEVPEPTASREGKCEGGCYRTAFLSVFLLVCICVCHWILFQDFQVLTQTVHQFISPYSHPALISWVRGGH